MITCPNCSRENKDDEKICVYCGAILSDADNQAATRSLGDTDYEEGRLQWGTARFGSRTYLIIQPRDTKDRHIFYFDEFEELYLGRMDPKTGESPDLDLSKYDGVDKGVSRRHASIVRHGTSLSVVDLESPNGTFLNGQKLIPNQTRVLRDGDEVRLGHLVLQISFMRE